MLKQHGDEFLTELRKVDLAKNPGAADMLPHVVDFLLSRDAFRQDRVAKLLAILRTQKSAKAAETVRKVTAVLSARIQNGEITGNRLTALKKSLQPVIKNAGGSAADFEILQLAASLRDRKALTFMAAHVKNTNNPEARRLAAARALIAAEDGAVLSSAEQIFADPKANKATFRGQLLTELGRLKDDKLAGVILKNYGKLEPELKPRAIELLTQRVNWSRQLMAAVGKKTVPANSINLNQARRLIGFKDQQLGKLVSDHWGIVRMGRDPKRAQYVAKWKTFIRKNHGDPFRGEKVFYKVCGQCHKMYGKGFEVGPDITRNGRNSFDQLLSNVFDPSLVIGSGYRAYNIATKKGRRVTGLLVEDSPQRVVLKVQGGKLETIARGDIDLLKKSKVSMMPEQLEKQLKPNEIADLFAFITLDRHPKDKNARQLPGVREVIPRQTGDPKQFGKLVAEVLPGFTTTASGERGVGLLRSYRGREPALRTHPVKRNRSCTLTGTFAIPKGKRTRLVLAVSHDRRGDWKLIVKANGSRLFETVVGPKSTTKGWADFSIDLTRFAGKTVKLELHNQATGWNWEFGYWHKAEIVSD